MTELDLYRSLAHELPNRSVLGGALITMVEPLPGREHAYNRWYEDDHFYAGAMAGPWTFAGRRYVATRSLRQSWRMRAPALEPPPGDGCYLSLYWITDGHVEQNQFWAMTAMYEELAPAGRASQDRAHIYTAFHDLAFGHVFDPPPMRIEHALDHPYGGVIAELVDVSEHANPAALLRWLHEDFVPTRPGPGQCLGFVPRSPQAQFSDRAPASGGPRRLCLLWFVVDDPQTRLPAHFLDHGAELARSGLGEVTLIAPFVPTVPGTDRYVDELR